MRQRLEVVGDGPGPSRAPAAVAASASTTSTSSSSATARCPSAAASPASAARPARSASSGSCTRRSGVAGPPTGRGSGVRSPSSSRRRRRSRNSRRAEHVGQLRAVGRLVDDLAQVEAVELVQVADDRPELLALERRLAVGGQRLLALGGTRSRFSYTPSSEPNSRSGSAAVLSPMPRRPGCCPWVALEADQVGHELARHAQAGLDALGRVHVDVRDAARGHHQAHAVGDELEGVTVGGDDRRLDARLVGDARERADHVVGLALRHREVETANASTAAKCGCCSRRRSGIGRRLAL